MMENGVKRVNRPHFDVKRHGGAVAQNFINDDSAAAPAFTARGGAFQPLADRVAVHRQHDIPRTQTVCAFFDDVPYQKTGAIFDGETFQITGDAIRWHQVIHDRYQQGDGNKKRPDSPPEPDATMSQMDFLCVATLK